MRTIDLIYLILFFICSLIYICSPSETLLKRWSLATMLWLIGAKVIMKL